MVVFCAKLNPTLSPPELDGPVKTGTPDEPIVREVEKVKVVLVELALALKVPVPDKGTHRSPFYVRLKDKKTQTELIVMTNHLARQDDHLRFKQAAGLREWARDQPVGVVNIGDFNMDYSFKKKRGNDAFPEMLRDGIWSWIPPEPLVDSQWSDRNGKDVYPNSTVDFAFVSGPAKRWNPKCRVIVRAGDFPDDLSTSDHRPVELRLTLPQK